MTFQKKPSLAFAPVKACSYVIFVIYCITGIYWMYDENRQYHKRIDEVTSRYYEDARKKIQTESSTLLRNIKNRERDAQDLINERLREKVATAYSLASHFYGLPIEGAGEERTKQTIIESLRPIRWNNNAGFYFIFDQENQQYLLHSQYPECEIPSQQNITELWLTGQKMREILYLKEAGFYRGYFNSVEIGKEENLYFIKKFLPFNWVVGGGISYKDIRLEVQHSVLARMKGFHFGEGGKFLCFDGAGRTIVDAGEQVVGRKIGQLFGLEGQSFVEDVVRSTDGDKKSAFFQYESDEDGKTVSRIAYVQKYQPWNWTIVSSVALENLDAILAIEKQRFKKSLVQGASIYFFIVFLTLVIVFLIAHYYSLEIAKSLLVFSRFLSNSTALEPIIDKGDIVYEEFHKLSDEIITLTGQRDDRLAQLSAHNIALGVHHKLVEGVPLEQVSLLALNQLLSLYKYKAGYILYYEGQQCQLLASTFALDKDPTEHPQIADRLREAKEKGKVVSGFFPDSRSLGRQLLVAYEISDTEGLIIHCGNGSMINVTVDEEQLTLILEKMWQAYRHQQKHNENAEHLLVFQSIVENSPIKTIVLDAHKELVFMSKSAQTTFGFEFTCQSEAYGQHLPFLKKIDAEITEVLSEKKYLSVQCIGEDLDRSFYSYQVHISPITVTGLNGVCLRIENSIEKSQVDRTLAESEKMLSVAGIVTGIAYELDKPLSSLSNRVEAIEELLDTGVFRGKKHALQCHADCKSKPLILDELNKVKVDSASANKLLSEMLSFTQEDELANLRTYVDIADIVNDSIEHALVKNGLSLNRDLRQIRLKREYKDIEMLSCHQDNLQLVFVNIISNALYAIADNFTLLSAGQMIIRIYQDMCWVTIEIEDNGSGVDEELNKRIFEPFFTTKKQGRGLGLSVASFIVTDQHEGQLSVYKTAKSGACFQVQLPVKRGM